MVDTMHIMSDSLMVLQSDEEEVTIHMLR